jgi:hypothetical protein
MKKSALLCLLLVTASCEVQTTEYRTRPSWQEAMGSDLPTQSTRSDGTIMKFASSSSKKSTAFDAYLKTVTLVEKDEITGKTTLKAILPEHIFTQTLTCLRDRDWDLIYDQILSGGARRRYGEDESGREQCNLFFENNREDVAKTFQRMLRGTGNGDVLTNEFENKVVYSFSNRVGVDYAFKSVTLVQEDQFLKLDLIR